MSVMNVKATPNGTSTMWKPRVKAIISRAGKSCGRSAATVWQAARSGLMDRSFPPLPSNARRGAHNLLEAVASSSGLVQDADGPGHPIHARLDERRRGPGQAKPSKRDHREATGTVGM
jgi:hypothetical protein